MQPAWLAVAPARTTRRAAGWAAIVTATVCALMGSPANAAPGDGTVPDSGSAPSISGVLQLPTAGQVAAGTTAAAPVASNPVVAQINTESAAVEKLGEDAKDALAKADEAEAARVSTEQAWQQTQQALTVAQQAASSEASDAYKAYTALGPLGQYESDVHQFGILAPGLDGQVAPPGGGEGTARDLLRAQSLEAAARAAYQQAVAHAAETRTAANNARASYDTRSAALVKLKQANKPALDAYTAGLDRFNQGTGFQLGVGTDTSGKYASAQALAALRYALSQRGKPYVWGAEGPDTFDCSGLTWAAYNSVGIQIPRVANDQYYAYRTRGVAVANLLPGDLLFFSTDKNDWRAIHHVAMYIGDGLMVHAPQTGDVVRVAPVWWAEYFGAVRVVGAVPNPATIPSTPGGTGGSPPTVPPPSGPTAQPPLPPIPTHGPSRPGRTPTTPTTPTTPSPSVTTPSPSITTPSQTPTTPSDTASTPSATETTVAPTDTATGTSAPATSSATLTPSAADSTAGAGSTSSGSATATGTG